MHTQAPLRFTRPVRLTCLAALIVSVVLVVLTQRLEADLQMVELRPNPTEASAAVPSGSTLRLVAMGYPEAMADMMWLDALSFLGANFKKRHSTDWLAPHLNAISTLDPQFSLVYEWAATVVMYSGIITNETVRASNEILEVGTARFPNSWELHFMLAVNYLVELRASDDEERAANVRYGTRMLSRASRMPGAPDWLNASASGWARRGSSWDAVRRSATDLHMTNVSIVSGRTGRLNLEDALGWSLATPVLADRRVMRCLERNPHWAMVPVTLAALIHPDPAWLCPNTVLYPPPLSEPQ